MPRTADRGGTLARVTIEDCLFDSNESGAGAAVCGSYGEITIRSCTVVRNVATSDFVPSALLFDGRAVATVERCIVAFNEGEGVKAAYPDRVQVTCAVLFENTVDAGRGADPSSVGEPEVIEADPLFCDLANGDFALRARSPCAPENALEGCGLIGAYSVGCATPTLRSTWGRIKEHFRTRD